MNKVLASLLMIGMVAAMAGAGTFAYFTDTETSKGNTFTAGTLDLWVEMQNPLKTHFDIGNIQPSYAEGCEINLTNSGTCDGYLSLWIENLVDRENGRTEPEKPVDPTGGNPGVGNGELSQNLYIVIMNETGAELYNDTLYNLSVEHHSMETQIDLGNLDGGETRNITVGYYVPSTVDNIIQSDSSKFDIVVDLLQIEMPKPYPTPTPP